MLPLDARHATLALCAAVEDDEGTARLSAFVRTAKSVLVWREALVTLPPFAAPLTLLVRFELLGAASRTPDPRDPPPPAQPAPVYLLRSLTAKYAHCLPARPVAPSATVHDRLREALVERERDAAVPQSWQEIRELDAEDDTVAENEVLRVSARDRLYEIGVAHHGVLAFLATDFWPAAAGPSVLFVNKGRYAVHVVHARTHADLPPAAKPYEAAVRLAVDTLGEASALVKRHVVRVPADSTPPHLERGSAMFILPTLLPGIRATALGDTAPASPPIRASARIMANGDAPYVLTPPLALWGRLGTDCVIECALGTGAGGATGTDAKGKKRKKEAVPLAHTLEEANSRKRRRLVMDTLGYGLFVRAVGNGDTAGALNAYTADVFSVWTGNQCPGLRSATLGVALQHRACPPSQPGQQQDNKPDFAPYSTAMRALKATMESLEGQQ